MTKRAYGQAMFALLGLGTADLAVLNLWAVPGWLSESPVTDMRSATDAPSRAPAALPKPAVAAAPPQAAAIAALAEAAPSPPAAAIAPTPRTERATSLRTNILFHRGTWWVGPAGRRTLRSSVERLAPDSRIELEGHADESGSAAINQRISARRAAAVAGLLVDAGIDPARIEQRAFGEEHAGGSGFDRRVELIIRRGP